MFFSSYRPRGETVVDGWKTDGTGPGRRSIGPGKNATTLTSFPVGRGRLVEFVSLGVACVPERRLVAFDERHRARAHDPGPVLVPIVRGQHRVADGRRRPAGRVHSLLMVVRVRAAFVPVQRTKRVPVFVARAGRHHVRRIQRGDALALSRGRRGRDVRRLHAGRVTSPVENRVVQLRVRADDRPAVMRPV